jgi:hypothetical protein
MAGPACCRPLALNSLDTGQPLSAKGVHQRTVSRQAPTNCLGEKESWDNLLQPCAKGMVIRYGGQVRTHISTESHYP